MIDVVIADPQEMFHVGMAEILAGEDDVRIVGQPQSPEQLLNTLKQVDPHILILSTSFLSSFSKIQRRLKKRQTALLVLAEDNDRTAYMRWLQAKGFVSVHGWPRHRRRDAPSRARRIVSSEHQLRYRKRPV